MPDLSVNFAGIRSPNPFWLASGPPANCGDQRSGRGLALRKNRRYEQGAKHNRDELAHEGSSSHRDIMVIVLKHVVVAKFMFVMYP